ncbi:DNA polymerase PolB subunit 2 [Methanothermobacter sp.]|uniref:DNA polymerase PolB subunit 2 n=1 Tax=Methanothermobacter sp. TaxID=1884223 RepID=UPI002634CDEE|nr:DNA polymerase PolB subunit 2 [Methanothermobacter sp.]MDI9617773.1 DNA polymerase PolB subunit 2 [Methanothermobacter sp.]
MSDNLEAEILSQVERFLEYINSTLPEGMELEFEGFYRRGFFVTKKRYALIEDDTIVAKGLELVRRDWAPIAKKTQQKVLMAILRDGSPKKAKKIIRDVVRRIRGGEVELDDLAIHTQITRDLSEYKQIGPHVIAAKRSLERGRRIERGSIIRYIIVKGRGPISQRAFPLEDAEGMEYDPDYYIENQVMAAVSRIMSSLGYSTEDINSLSCGERQSSLDAFF